MSRLPPIVDHISDQVGCTPLVRIHLKAQSSAIKCELLGKCEFLNPGGSLKDRVAKRVLEDLESQEKISSDSTLIIPTSGNLSIGLALFAARKGYHIVAIIPDKTSIEKIQVLKSLGVEILRTPADAHHDSPESHVGVAKKLAADTPNSLVIDEYSNQFSVAAHEETADEILQQCNDKLDMIVVGVESGGSITAIANRLRAKLPNIRVIGVDAKGSSITNPDEKLVGNYKTQGLGTNFTPPLLNKSLVDEWEIVSDAEAFGMARRLIAEEGLLCGSSSGAVVAAAFRAAVNLESTQRCVVLLNDSARNYDSTLLNESWLIENDLLDKGSADRIKRKVQKWRGAAIAELNLAIPVSISKDATIGEALTTMEERDFDQLPVINAKKKMIGFVSKGNLRLQETLNLTDSVEKWMYKFSTKKKYIPITLDTPLVELWDFFEHNPVAFVTDTEFKWCLGVVTKYDLIDFLNKRNGSLH
ncbi:PALP-domain-containing protein [Basidiobolus meristosporus CBS 931.73]|uniref:cystathionine beta-synthase n=1 Tax=Basidiobolus meristosporus CBS 931.73 TaxID=1314790 RepID=A0A1Y1XNW6_9FUNG|nr:PALP-domain-containing protein [Basidiobolus meristosporus CBS 931.73]|eukprot:ORX87014.1 PALP-domain-containing protein [Basidiobolus meristosporus CBS 931.73]